MSDASSPGSGLSLHGIAPRALASRIWRKIDEHELMTRAAAVSYYALTALVPFLGLVVTFAVQLLPDITGPSGSRAPLGGMTVDEFREELSRMLPNPAFDIVAVEIARLQKEPPLGLLSVGLVMSLLFASSVTGAIRDTLNRIYDVPETRSYIRLTLTSMGLTLLQATIVLGTLNVLVVGPRISEALGWRHEPSFLRQSTEWLLVAAGILVSLEVLLYFGPNVKRAWRWITPGAVVAMVAILGTSLLFRQYAIHFTNYGKWYGSLGGVLLLLFWFWINSLVLFVAVLINKIIDDKTLFDRMGLDALSQASAVDAASVSKT